MKKLFWLLSLVFILWGCDDPYVSSPELPTKIKYYIIYKVEIKSLPPEFWPSNVKCNLFYNKKDGSIVHLFDIGNGWNELYGIPAYNEKLFISANLLGRGTLNVEIWYYILYDNNKLDSTLVKNNSAYGDSVKVEALAFWQL